MHSPNLHLLDRMLVSRNRKMPLHLQVQNVLRHAIDQHFEDGQTFWTEAALMEKLGVSRATVRQALMELSREGLLMRQAAKGSVVTKGEVATTIGVFFHRYNSDFQSEMLEQIAGECLERNLRLELYNTHDGNRITDAFENVKLPPHRVRLILLGETSETTLQLYEALEERGYRTVTVDTVLAFPGSCVTTDNELAVQIGVGHLSALGHRRIVLLINEPERAETCRLKMAAFTKLCGSQDLAGSRIVSCGTQYGESSFDAAYHIMEQVWALEPRPTAIYTVSDPGAWAVLKWFAERRIEVPGQVSVLGFEGVRPSRFTHPALSTVAHPISDLARRAVEMLWEERNKQEFLAPQLIVRESTGPVPA